VQLFKVGEVAEALGNLVPERVCVEKEMLEPRELANFVWYGTLEAVARQIQRLDVSACVRACVRACRSQGISGLRIRVSGLGFQA